MRVAIVNFSRQNLVSPQEIMAAVQRLPQEHYAKIKIIRYDPERSLALEMAYINNNPESLRARGTYLHDWESSDSVVVIYPFKTRDVFFHTLYHEIGHHVFFRVLDQSLRDEWFALRRVEKGFVSKRARKDAREDFAETYSCLCFRCRLLNHAPQKADFMLRKVFRRVPAARRYV
ncbi:hypothetical protein [Desulfonatronospira sp.]|uniref:hypothetical protein n=1 Tax=Desulfonatronospira sp. TaxID=1962951 RepID=UPI0025C1EBEB|nr:hypothetical protein [Desulfonatronospira sp.]